MYFATCELFRVQTATAQLVVWTIQRPSLMMFPLHNTHFRHGSDDDVCCVGFRPAVCLTGSLWVGEVGLVDCKFYI